MNYNQQSQRSGSRASPHLGPCPSTWPACSPHRGFPRSEGKQIFAPHIPCFDQSFNGQILSPFLFFSPCWSLPLWYHLPCIHAIFIDIVFINVVIIVTDKVIFVFCVIRRHSQCNDATCRWGRRLLPANRPALPLLMPGPPSWPWWWWHGWTWCRSSKS